LYGIHGYMDRDDIKSIGFVMRTTDDSLCPPDPAEDEEEDEEDEESPAETSNPESETSEEAVSSGQTSEVFKPGTDSNESD